MDNLTHSLFALTLAQTPLRRMGRGTTLTLLLASNAPDADAVVALTGGAAAYLDVHRGSSHGPLGVIGFAVLVALLVRGFQRDRRGTGDRGPSPWGRLFAVALIGTLGHTLMDLPTPYGTHSLRPFDETWYSLDWMPIVEPFLLALLAGGLLLVAWRPARRYLIAGAVLLSVGLLYGLRAESHARALAALSRDGTSAPAALATWPATSAPKLPSDYACSDPACPIRAAALPSFGSPFQWTLVRQFGTGYQISRLDLLADEERGRSWRAHLDTPAVERARLAFSARTFLAFSRFPIASRGDSPAPASVGVADGTTIRFTDVRFLDQPVRQQTEGLRPRGLFTVTVVLDAADRIVFDGFGAPPAP